MDSKHIESPRAARRNKERYRTRLAIPFFVLLYLLTLLAFMIPLRPSRSMSEKRDLASFPPFSISSLSSGDFFDAVSIWFSDTFPGRELWLSAASAIDSLHGIDTNVVKTATVTAEEIPDTATQAATKAVTLPEPSAVITDSPVDKKDDAWGGLNVAGDEETLFGNCVQIGGSAFELYGFTQYLADCRIMVINRGVEALAGLNVRIFDMPIPSGISVMLSPDFVDELGCSQQSEAINYLFSGESKDIVKVNLLDALVEHNNEYIYYRTDHHWTALGAYYGYLQYCEAANLTPVELDSYTKGNMGEFLGSFYYSSTKSGKLKSDELIAYYPPGNLSMTITESDGWTHDMPVVSDMSEADVNAKYDAFIGGDHHMTVITNRDLPNAPNCVIIKDSYGNPFSVYLSQNYHHVYILDYRKWGSALSEFVTEYDIDDVIIAESMSMTQGESTIGLFSSILR